MPTLKRVATQSSTLPDRIIAYAPAKWGKTTFAAGFPKPIFLTTRGEDGLQKLISVGRLPPTDHFQDLATTWHDIHEAVDSLINDKHDYQTFVLDTGNGAEQLAQELVCREQFQDNWGETGFTGFGRGEKITMQQYWTPFLTKLDRLRETRRMRILICCHAEQRFFQNAEGPNYDRVEPALSKQAWKVTSKWSDMIIFGTFKTETQKDAGGKFAKAKGKGGRDRVLYTERTATFDAGNRHGLPPIIDMPDSPTAMFRTFVEAFPKAQRPTVASPPQDTPTPTPVAVNGAA